MKKEYKKPIVINHNQDVNILPLVAVATSSFSAGRAIAKAMGASPIKEGDLKCLK